METAQQLYYWMRIGILLLVTVLAVFMAIRQARARPYSTTRDVLIAVGQAAAYLVLLLVTGVSVSVLWSVVLFLVGLAVGYPSPDVPPRSSRSTAASRSSAPRWDRCSRPSSTCSRP